MKEKELQKIQKDLKKQELQFEKRKMFEIAIRINRLKYLSISFVFYLKLNVPINCLAAGVDCPAPEAILTDISDTAILETSPLARPAHLALPMKRGNPSLHQKLSLDHIF